MTQIRLTTKRSPISPSLLPLSGANRQIWVHCQVSVDQQRKIEQDLRNKIKLSAQIGDYATAIALLTQLLRYHPESAMDYNNRGLMYFYNQQYQKSLQDYDLAITLDPQLDQAYNNRANCYSRQGKRFAALHNYQIALDLNPWNLRALINLGITYRELGDYSAALEQFDIALLFGQKTGYQGRLYGERGYTYHLRGDWNGAIADYRRALDYLSTHNQLAYQTKIQGLLEQLLSQN
ncbi:MAG: tetratricopeptide repeat protein [Microcystaceae cyanobacterium]